MGRLRLTLEGYTRWLELEDSIGRRALDGTLEEGSQDLIRDWSVLGEVLEGEAPESLSDAGKLRLDLLVKKGLVELVGGTSRDSEYLKEKILRVSGKLPKGVI